MPTLLLGGSGQIGWELQRSLSQLGEVLAPPRDELDLLDLGAVRDLVRRAQPRVIVNAAAYTDVDRAESEPELARILNVHLPTVLATEAEGLGAAFIHYSTDYVFDGSKGRPYVEDDGAHPLCVYGRTKLEGEQAVEVLGGLFLILRTGWVYSLRRSCFVTRVLEWARRQPTLRIATDQVGSPTWCRTVAEATAGMLSRFEADGVEWLRRYAGVYHLACRGAASRYEWARAILHVDPAKSEQVVEDIQPASSAEFPAQAVRPPYSALDSSRFSQVFGVELPEWQDALRQSFTTESHGDGSSR